MNPWLTLNFVEVFITSLYTSSNSQVQALEVWCHPLEIPGHIYYETSYALQSFVGYPVLPHQGLQL